MLNPLRWLRLLATRGLGGLAGLLATLAATRLLGTHDAGLLFLALAIVTVVAGLARLGIDSPLTRFVGAHADEADKARVNGVFRLALAWALATTLVAGVLLFLLRQPLAVHVFSQPRLGELLAWLAWLVPVMALYLLHSQAFIGMRRPDVASMIQNLLLPATFVLLLWSFAAQGNVDGPVAAACYLGAGVATLLVSASLWWCQPWARQPGSFDADALWQAAKPMWVVTFANLVIQWGGQLAAGALLQPADVAHLTAAQRVAMLISLALGVANMVAAPHFAALHHRGDRAALQTLAQRLQRYMLLFATPLTLVLALAAPLVMSLFGSDFADAAVLLVILLAGQWINALTGSVGLLLTMTGHERDLRNSMLTTALAAIPLLLVLTWLLGSTGTAIAMSLAMAILNVGNLLIVRRRLGFLTLG